MAEAWNVEGKYFEACNCETACPCLFLSDPTEGTCDAVVAWHIDRGTFGDVVLDGLNAAAGIHAPGNMTDGHWRLALYLDERASEGQRDALGRIFGGQVGGHPAKIAQLVGEVAAVSVVPLRVETDGARRGSLRIGDVGEVEVEGLAGQGGEVPRIEGHPFAVAPGYALGVGRSRSARLDDAGIHLAVTGRNGLLSPFRYQGP